MKVERLTIQRISVLLSCGCNVLCDFKDPLCKNPFRPETTKVEGETLTEPLLAAKEFTICAKHKKDASKSMLEFMMSERMDEAIADAQRPMLRASPGASVMPQSTELQGESVQRVATLPAGANRPRRDPTQVKKMARTTTQLKTAGAVLDVPQQAVMDGDVEIGPAGGASSMDELLDIIAPEKDASR